MPSVPGAALSRPNRVVRHGAKMAKSEATFDVKELAGITAPLGFFDPVGFTTDATEGKIRFYREVDLECWQPWVSSWLSNSIPSLVETLMLQHTSLS